MGTTESHLSYRPSDAVVKEIIINKDTIVVVSTPVTVEIFQHWYTSGKITDTQTAWLVAGCKESRIETSWFEAGNELTKAGRYYVNINIIKTPAIICIHFSKSYVVYVHIAIAGEWHRLEKTYKVSCIGNEIRLD